jgi:hypothetical protein
MQVLAENRVITPVEEKIILTLMYFDIFNYPLKVDEIIRFLGTNHITEDDIRNELVMLRRKRFVYQFDNLFTLQNNEANVTRRLRGNVRAKKYLPVAMRKARLIAKFPFVRGVLASGSLAKGYMDQNSDLDFFIITEPKRLWITRMLLVMYKRIFLFNSHKLFCVNYFIDADHLELEEKNLFTATELATAIPLYGRQYYRKLHDNNAWVSTAFPNFKMLPLADVEEFRAGVVKRAVEGFINFVSGDWLEQYFRRVTMRRWKKIYEKDYGHADFDVAFKSKEYVSKNHPNHYQQRVENMYASKVNAFKVKLESTWDYA